MTDDRCGICPGRFLGEAGQLLGPAVDDIIPREAQVHLFNAQRELLLAVKLTIEHHTRSQQAAERRARRQRRRPVRVDLE